MQPVFEFIKNCKKEGRDVTLSGLYSFMDIDNSADEIKATANYAFTPELCPELTFESCVLKNKEKYLKNQIMLCEAKLENVSTEEQTKLMESIMAFNKQLIEINKKLQELSLEYVRKTNDLARKKDEAHKEE